MMAYYHFLIKQFSYNFNKDCKQVIENRVMVNFSSNVSKKRLGCQSKEAQNLSQVMLSTRSSLAIQREHPNQTQNQPKLCLSLTNLEMCTCRYASVHSSRRTINSDQSE